MQADARTAVKRTYAQRETLPIAAFALDGNKWDGLYLGRRSMPERSTTVSTKRPPRT
jgi:bifunctional non-homologous end joining protein LigD